MWLVTTRGFYSVVAHREEPDALLVRARSRGDLENLCELADEALDDPAAGGFSASEVLELDEADYRFRLKVSRDAWAAVAGRLLTDIDYPNFKDSVSATDANRAGTYMDVWGVLRGITH